jgi:anti-sigma B factor antagonist
MQTVTDRPLTVTITTHPQATVARLSGDAGVPNASDLERMLLPLSSLRGKRIVLDLSELDFISSVGMGSIVALQRGVARAGGDVRLAAVPDMIRQAFRHARLEPLFTFHGTVEEAMRGDPTTP